MNYETAKSKIFCQASIPNGYFGDRITVGVALLGTRVYIVHDHGCHWAGAVAISTPEVTWLINNHPNFKNWKIQGGAK